jgi:FtsP/CotA-like multicopper oxidase with cupredoxin domain
MRPLRVAGGTHPSPLAREGDEQLVLATLAAHPREAVRQHSAFNNTSALGTAEAWALSAAMHMHGNAEGHPFHIHVNSFEVKEITNASGKLPQPPGTIMDTLWVGVNQSALLWMRFDEFVGKTVYHCHILPHEDTGMMANLLIRRP